MSVLYYPPTQNALQKSLNADLNTGVTASLTLNNTTGVQNKPGVIVIDRIDTDGNLKSTSVREWIIYQGTSGSTLTSLTRGVGGSTDQDHSTGAVVEFVLDITWAQSVINALDGTSAGVVLTVGQTITSPNLVIGSDAAGDMYYRNAGASLSRLPKGNNSQVLKMNASLPVWNNPYPMRQGYTTITDAATMIIDFSVNNKFMTTIVPDGSARTFLPTNATLGDMALLRVQYASTASFAMTFFNSNATLSWQNGNTLPSFTQTVNKADIFGFMCMATLPKFDGVVVATNL